MRSSESTKESSAKQINLKFLVFRREGSLKTTQVTPLEKSSEKAGKFGNGFSFPRKGSFAVQYIFPFFV